MRFTWDPVKSARTIAQRGIAFTDAIRIFDGWTLERVDARLDYGEERIVAIGVTELGELTAVYTESSDDGYHIISARRATNDERKAYWHARPAES